MPRLCIPVGISISVVYSVVTLRENPAFEAGDPFVPEVELVPDEPTDGPDPKLLHAETNKQASNAPTTLALAVIARSPELPCCTVYGRTNSRVYPSSEPRTFGWGTKRAVQNKTGCRPRVTSVGGAACVCTVVTGPKPQTSSLRDRHRNGLRDLDAVYRC